MNPLILTLALLHGCDAGTTHYALTTGRGREVVWPTQNPYVIDAGMVGQFGVELALWKWSRKHGHRRLVAGLLIGVAAVHGFAAAHNVKELMK